MHSNLNKATINKYHLEDKVLLSMYTFMCRSIRQKIITVPQRNE